MPFCPDPFLQDAQLDQDSFLADGKEVGQCELGFGQGVGGFLAGGANGGDGG